jgi:hypothetical protein
LLDSLSPVEKGTTNTSGAMTFEKTGTKFWFNPSAKNPAYGQAYVTATWAGARICYPDECREILVKPIGGVVEVPLPSRLIVPDRHPQGAVRDDPDFDRPKAGVRPPCGDNLPRGVGDRAGL